MSDKTGHMCVGYEGGDRVVRQGTCVGGGSINDENSSNTLILLILYLYPHPHVVEHVVHGDHNVNVQS